MAKVALLVGVSEYEPGLNPLPGSVKDVDAMQRVLAHPEMGGFAEADITVLKNPQRQAMEDAIYSLFSDRKKDDLLLFYFSGHGIKDENGRLYLATRATRKDSNGRLVPPSAVAAASLHENINASRSQRQVMILDCCFSGAVAQGMTVKDDGTVNLKDYLGGKGRAILTSSTSTEYSFGSATPGHEDEGLSIYTRYLVEGIEKGAADTDGDGWIAVEELHEYAANRVKDAAPAMTPKFYPVEEGYKIVLARSRKDDPKLKYRKEAQARAEQGQGQFSIIAQRLLKGKRIEWGISAEEAKAIEDEVLQPYREYELKQQEYEQALAEVVQAGYPLSAVAEAELKEYQQHLGLRDSDIAAIEARILVPLRAQLTQQSAAYQQNLVQYEQTLTDAIQQEFPFSQQTRQELERLQQSLDLRDEDIARVEKPLIQQAELRHQEKLRQEAERQQQEQEKAEYNNKLQRYEQEFTKTIQAEYPLMHQPVLGELKSFQQQLGLKDEDIARIEQPIYELAEAKYLEELKQQKEVRQQQQAELEIQQKLYQQNLNEYKQAFLDIIQGEFPLKEQTRQDLDNWRKTLDLRSEDIVQIEQPILKRLEVKYQERFRQTREVELRQESLQRYKQAFVESVQKYPVTESARNRLKRFQDTLGLSNEEVADIEQPILKRLEVKYQERFRQTREVELRQESLQRYKQAFVESVQKYPVTESARNRLKRFQDTLGLSNEEVADIEQPILESCQQVKRGQQRKLPNSSSKLTSTHTKPDSKWWEQYEEVPDESGNQRKKFWGLF